MKQKNLQKRLTLLVLTALFISSGYSQENFLSGVVTTISGDSINGFIDYRNWESNPKEINFKALMGDKPVHYSVKDLLEFRVAGEVYVSAIVKNEISSVQTSRLNSNSDLVIKIDTIFLQTLFNGNKCLYYYNNKGKENFYIKDKNQIELLIYKRYLIEEKQSTVVSENKKYQGQLTFYLQDCPSIKSKINSTQYNFKSLETLFLNYYKCTSSDSVFKKEKDRTIFEFGALAGVTTTKVVFSSYYFPYLVESDYSPSINFTTGLFLDIILPRNQGKWSINNELVYSSYLIEGEYSVYENPDVYTNVSTELGYSYLTMNNMLRFKYPVGATFVFVNAGLSNGYAIAETNYMKIEANTYTTYLVKEGKALEDVRKYQQGFLAGLGLKYKNISFEMRYEKANGMSEYDLLTSKTKKLQFLLGYKF